MKPNSRTKTTNAIPFTCGTTFSLEILRALLRFPSHEIDHGGEHRAHQDPEKLKPVKEGDAEQRRFRLVIKRRPEDHEKLQDEEQVPPAPLAAFARRTVLCGHRRNVYGYCPACQRQPLQKKGVPGHADPETPALASRRDRLEG